MRRGGEGERRFRLNRPTQYFVQTEQGLTSTASTMTVQALADDFAVGAQNSLLKTNQIGVEPNLSISHACRSSGRGWSIGDWGLGAVQLPKKMRWNWFILLEGCPEILSGQAITT